MLGLSLLQLSLGVLRLMMSNFINRDYIEHRDIPALQQGVCKRVHACAIEIKPGTLRATFFIGVCVKTRIQPALQDGHFLAKKGFFDNVYRMLLHRVSHRFTSSVQYTCR